MVGLVSLGVFATEGEWRSQRGSPGGLREPPLTLVSYKKYLVQNV